jgi:hypothetical protein
VNRGWGWGTRYICIKVLRKCAEGGQGTLFVAHGGQGILQFRQQLLHVCHRCEGGGNAVLREEVG